MDIAPILNITGSMFHVMKARFIKQVLSVKIPGLGPGFYYIIIAYLNEAFV